MIFNISILNTTSNFKTIKEVSEQFNIPQHVLRFWESKFQQLSPLKLSGNRRYYRKIDIELINYIKNLLYVDCISIKGVQKIFGNQTINKLLKNENKLLKKSKSTSTDSNQLETGNSDKDLKKNIKKVISELKSIKNLIDK